MKTSRIAIRTTDEIRGVLERESRKLGINLSATVLLAVTEKYGSGQRKAPTARKRSQAA
jgi:hypothetical protein